MSDEGRGGGGGGGVFLLFSCFWVSFTLRCFLIIPSFHPHTSASTSNFFLFLVFAIDIAMLSLSLSSSQIPRFFKYSTPLSLVYSIDFFLVQLFSVFILSVSIVCRYTYSVHSFVFHT